MIDRDKVTLMAKDYLIYNRSIKTIAKNMKVEEVYVSQCISKFLSTPNDVRIITDLIKEQWDAPALGSKGESYYSSEKEMMESPIKFSPFTDLITYE